MVRVLPIHFGVVLGCQGCGWKKNTFKVPKSFLRCRQLGLVVCPFCWATPRCPPAHAERTFLMWGRGVITMQPHLDALKTFLNVKGLGTPETTCIQISLATIFIHQNAFDSDLVKQVPIMRTILGGYTADDYRSCSESWECSLEKAKSNLDKRLAEERLLLGMVLQSFSEEIPDANLTGSAKQLISDAAAAYTEMTPWFAEHKDHWF